MPAQKLRPARLSDCTGGAEVSSQPVGCAYPDAGIPPRAELLTVVNLSPREILAAQAPRAVAATLLHALVDDFLLVYIDPDAVPWLKNLIDHDFCAGRMGGVV